MKRYLEGKGVPPDRLLLEDQSRNTAENIANSKGILLKRNWEQIHLITHDYHMSGSPPRRKSGNRRHACPVHSRVLFTPFYKVRECLAIIKMWIQETLG